MAAPALVRPRERLVALAAVAVVQLGLGFALLTGLRVDFARASETVERLITVDMAKPPPPPPPPPTVQPKPHPAPAPRAQPAPLGGSPGPKPAHALPSVTPVVRLPATAAPSGGGTGAGPASGSGAGGGSGGQGEGDGGGTDLVQIAGEITSRDYPRDLREAGIGGRVGVLFTVGVDGRVTRCSVTRSSGAPELDQLTCRLIQQRFRYRPSTDRFGRPIADEVDGEHDWIAR